MLNANQGKNPSHFLDHFIPSDILIELQTLGSKKYGNLIVPSVLSSAYGSCAMPSVRRSVLESKNRAQKEQSSGFGNVISSVFLQIIFHPIPTQTYSSSFLGFVYPAFPGHLLGPWCVAGSFFPFT